MNIIETEIPGVLLIEPTIHGDERGWFSESWQADRYAAAGIPGPFVQDNLAKSGKGILRGLHVQHPHAQGKLVQVISGAVFDVAVDIRVGSPTFAQWVGVELSGDTMRQFWVPAGFAHGYLVTSDEAVFSYKCTDTYHPETELGIVWNDPDIGVKWPLDGRPLLSAKDAAAFSLNGIEKSRLPEYA